VKNQMRHVLRAGTQLKDGKTLRRGVESQPEPLHLCRAAQPGAQFIQLERRESEMGEEAFMQGVCVRARARQPGGDGGLSVALRPARSRMGPALRSTQRAPWRPGERAFSAGSGACCAGRVNVVRQA